MEPVIGPDELLEQRAFLKRLARGLVGDEGLAEDVVQEVELRALARPPETKENLAGWLVAVTRNLARNTLRARARRERHELAAASDALVSSPADVAEALDLQRRVLDAVRALAEPYRTAVWLRYYEDLTPSAIAERTGTPLATVKTRLRRALHELRSELDRAAGGERRAWVALLAPLARGPNASVPVVGTVAGVLAMKKLAVVIGLAVLCWFGWRSVRSAPPESSPHDVAERVAIAAPAAERATLDEPAPTTSTAREPLRDAPTAAELASAPSLEVRLTWARDGAPAADIGVTWWRDADARPELSARAAVTDTAGRARFDELAPGACTLHLDRDRTETLELAAGEARVLELVLADGVDVVGTVVDERGAAVVGAELWLETNGSGLLAGRVVGRSGAGGAFALRGLGEEQALAASHPERATSPLERLREKVPLPGERALRLTLVLGPEREALAGVVFDALGRPLPGALVAIGSWGNDSIQASNGRWLPQVKARVFVCDDAGRFRTAWAHPTLAPVYVLAPEHALAHVEGQAGRTLEIRLVRGATIEGRAFGADGAPVGGALVGIGSAGGVGRGPLSLPSTRTDADGAYRLEHVPPGEVVLECRGRGAVRLYASEQRVLADGERVRWDLGLRPSLAISGQALDPARHPIPHALVMVDRGQGRSLLEADDEGRFSLTVRDPEQRYDLALVIAGSERARRDGVGAGETVELVAAAESAALRGRFADRGGRVRAGEKASVHLYCAVERPVQPVADIAADGSFVFPDLTPGRYRLGVQSESVDVARGDWFELADGESLDLGLIESRAAGSLVVEFRTPAGEPCFPSAWLRSSDGANRSLLRDGELWRADELEPGRYRLRTNGLHLADHEEELEIASGAETRLTVIVRPGVGRRLRVQRPVRATFAELEVVVRDVLTGEVVAHASEEGAYLWLPVGRLAVEVTTDTGLRGATEVEIRDLATEDGLVVVELH